MEIADSRMINLLICQTLRARLFYQNARAYVYKGARSLYLFLMELPYAFTRTIRR